MGVEKLQGKPQKISKMKPARGSELAWGGSLHKYAKSEETIILCWDCKKPIWIVWPVKILGKYSVEQRKATPIGHNKSLEKQTVHRKIPDYHCPLCGGIFARLNNKTGAVKYMTNRGQI